MEPLGGAGLAARGLEAANGVAVIFVWSTRGPMECRRVPCCTAAGSAPLVPSSALLGLTGSVCRDNNL